MITSTIQPPPSDGDTVGLHARGPLLTAFGLAIGWLVASGVFSLIAAIQLHSAAFLADCEYLTHGRVRALAETSFVYGWAGGAGISAVVLILSRLGGNPLRAANWFGAGSVFWNLGIAAGLVGIATGDMTSFSLLQLPRYVQPLMVFASAAMGIAGLLAWSGRRRDGTFASHWYGVAGLVLLPWALTAAQVSLLWFPMRGVLQAVAAAWYTEAVIFLWLTPLSLACACYLAAKLVGRALPSYEAAPLAFWMLIVVGTWSAGRHLVGGPVPAWIPTMAVFSFSMLLYHFAVVGLNLRPVFGLSGSVGSALKFGVGSYLLYGAVAFLACFRGIALRTQFTHFASATEQLFLYGSVSMILFAALYFLVPQLLGRGWSSPALMSGHLAGATIGVVLSVVALGWAGISQGAVMLEPKTGFGEIASGVRPYLLVNTGAQLVLLASNLLLAVNFLRSLCSCCQGSGVSTALSEGSAS
ncbi:MAG: cbb3-type cytochrome c oxidase subunit I [Opitutaceae bacterium]|nr:cbb3-type cytochrome c oxidase subunit I [Opitutaceae bacterium]